MAFKMNGSPVKMGTISGTAGHASALKQVNINTGKVEIPALEDKKRKDGEPYVSKEGKEMAGDKAWKKGQDKAKSKGNNLDALVGKRNVLKKGSDEYNVVQNQINQALGSKKRHGVTGTTETKGNKTTTKTSTPGTSNTSKKTVKRKDNTVKKVVTKTEDSTSNSKEVKKLDKQGVVTKIKTKSKEDVDNDGKIDVRKKGKTTFVKGGNKVKKSKQVKREGGRRTVTKIDKEGNVTTKSRRTLKGFLTGKGKKNKEE